MEEDEFNDDLEEQEEKSGETRGDPICRIY